MKMFYKLFLFVGVLLCFSFPCCAKETVKPNAGTKEIQQAIDRLSERGGTVSFPPGTYNITEPIILPSFVTLEGEEGTVFKAVKDMPAVIQTKGYSSFIRSHQAMWHDTSDVPMGFAVSSIRLDGNHCSTAGIQIYGYGFGLDNVSAENCDTGIMTDWSGWDGKDTWNDNYSKFFEAHANHIEVRNCRTGIQWDRLTDAYLNDISLSECQTGMDVCSNIYMNNVRANHCFVGINTDSDSSLSDVSLSDNDCGICINNWHITIDGITGTGNKQDALISSESKHILIRDARLSTVKNLGEDVRIEKASFSVGNKDIPSWDVRSTRTITLPSATIQEDSTKTIQDAVDSLRGTGGIVYLSSGVYRITKKLLLYSDVYLVGEGTYSTNIYLSDTANTDMLESIEGSESFGIKDIGFFGNKYNNQKGSCLRIRGSGFRIDNVWIDAASENGIEIVPDGNKQSCITNLNVKYCKGKGTVVLGNPDVSFDNLTVSECGNTGLEIHSPVFIGYSHLYANHGDYQYVDEGGASVRMMVSESADGIATLLKKPSRIGTLQTYSNKGESLFADSAGVKTGIFHLKDFGSVRENHPVQYDISFILKKADLKISEIPAQEYRGTPICPNIKVCDGQTELQQGKDYTVTWKNNTNVGTAVGQVTCTGDYEGEKSFSFSVVKRDISRSKISGISNKMHTGKSFSQSVVTKDNNRTLQRNKDYKISYKNNRNVGEAKCIITGINNYKGSVVKTFKILPKRQQ